MKYSNQDLNSFSLARDQIFIHLSAKRKTRDFFFQAFMKEISHAYEPFSCGDIELF